MIAAGFITKKPDGSIDNPRSLRPHSLRHALNSALLDLGADSEKVRHALGWSDERVQRGYTHPRAMSYDDLRVKVDEILGEG